MLLSMILQDARLDIGGKDIWMYSFVILMQRILRKY